MENEFIVCQKCGEQNPAANNFCEKCSAPLKENLPPVQQFQPQVVQPKKKGKGCLIALGVVGAVIILIIIIAVASNAGKSTTTNANSTSSNQTLVQTSSKTVSKISDTGTLGDYAVSVESARLVKDYQGKNAIIVKYKFTNNADKATSFMIAIGNKAFQDGVQLETAIITDDKTYNVQNSLKDIQKGASLEVEEGYLLSSDKSVVSIEASELISFNDTKLTKTFDITKLS
jgi:hypothetical protein